MKRTTRTAARIVAAVAITAGLAGVGATAANATGGPYWGNWPYPRDGATTAAAKPSGHVTYNGPLSGSPCGDHLTYVPGKGWVWTP